MATHTIKLGTGYRNHQHPEKSKISLHGKQTTKVKPGDTVIWESKNPHIGAFLILFNDWKKIRLFGESPSPLVSSKGKKWKVIISSDALPGTVYEYSICWVQDEQVYAFDPKIQVN